MENRIEIVNKNTKKQKNCKEVAPIQMLDNNGPRDSELMEEFDQFVLHTAMQKQLREVVGEESSSQGHDKESYQKECQLDNLANIDNAAVDETNLPLAEKEKVLEESVRNEVFEAREAHISKTVGSHNAEFMLDQDSNFQEIEYHDCEDASDHMDTEQGKTCTGEEDGSDHDCEDASDHMGTEQGKTCTGEEDASDHDCEDASDHQEIEQGRTSTGGEEYVFPTPAELNNSSPPAVGMVFQSLEEAVRFVNVYAQLSGFSIIKGRNYKGRKYTLICNKGRKTISSVVGPRKRKRRTIDRTGCGMNVNVKLDDDGIWRIISQNLEHNHDLVQSPSLTKFFLSHQHMNEEEIMLSQLLQEIRVKPKGIMTIFRKLRGHFGNIMFSSRRLDNLKQRERKQKKNSDIEYTMKYIEKIQLSKPGFCYRLDVDSEDTVRSIFWTDARSRLDYKMYGEIISFDTTYSTNRYNMPFAPIIGINGHGRTIVFGWALLKDQTADTFKWLFRKFVEVMEGKKPRLILTDQDKAMKKAISDLFPTAWHRWCIWHVFRKMREHLSPLMATMEGMEEEIIRVVMESLYVEEFKQGWKEMEIKYDCGNHDHIKRMWKKREMFVPAYFRGQFCPFTRSTSRSESFNSNFKDYVKRKDTIETFMKQYELFQENVVEIENKDRFGSTGQIPTFWGNQLIERHASKVYTKGIYLKFLTELLNSQAFALTEVEKDKEYKVTKRFKYAHPEFWRETFTIHVDRSMMKFQCECNKFERDGVLCCHILRIFTQLDIAKIPDHYIVQRWTNEFREKELLKHKLESVEIHGDSSAENALRYAMLMNSVSDVCSDISRDQEKSKEFIEEVHKLHARLMADTVEHTKKKSDAVVLKDPPVLKKSTKNVDTPSPEGLNAQEDAAVTKRVKKPVNTKANPVSVAVPNSKGWTDPPVLNAVSVVKGNRLKPQSEKKMGKNKTKRK